MTDSDPHYYSYFVAQGRGLLADELGVGDPFALSPAEVVERVLAAGYGPNVDGGHRHTFARTGKLDLVGRGEQFFLVSINREAERIMVQEVRQNPYEAQE